MRYLIFLGDSIDIGSPYESMLQKLHSIIEEFPEDVFFIKGNNECAFYDIFLYNQPEIQQFLNRLHVSMFIKNRDQNIFCSHGGIPVYKDKKGLFRSCKEQRIYDLYCIFNSNEFSGERASVKNKDFFYDSFRNCGCVIPDCVELFFLKQENINYCITGHVHKNQRVVDKDGILRHITICSSKKIRSGEKIPTAYVIFNDGQDMFLSLDDFSENKFIGNFVLE